MKAGEALIMRPLLPGVAFRTRHARVPSQGLEFRLPGQRIGDESAEFRPGHLPAGFVEGGDGMEHFHRAHDLSPQHLRAVLGHLAHLFLRFAAFPVVQQASHEHGEERAESQRQEGGRFAGRRGGVGH